MVFNSSFASSSRVTAGSSAAASRATLGTLQQAVALLTQSCSPGQAQCESAPIGGGDHRLLAIYPISGPPAMMRDRDDSKFRWRDLINHAVGKSAQGEPTPGATKDCAGERIGKNEVGSSVEFCKECEPELDIRFRRIERCRFIQFGES